jgi:hypothetical protein
VRRQILSCILQRLYPFQRLLCAHHLDELLKAELELEIILYGRQKH